MDENIHRRRWLSFGIRDLLWAMVVVAISTGWWAGQRREIAEPVVQHSYLMWYYSSLGFHYALALPLAGLFALVMTILLLVRCPGHLLGGALAFVVVTPVLVGLMGTVSGAMASCQVIGDSSVVSPQTPRLSEVAEGISKALVSMHIGLFLAFPSFAIATIGLAYRAMANPAGPTRA